MNAVGNNSAVWAQIFGAQDFRNIKDLRLRENLARLMTFDYSIVSLASVSKPYREQVRKIIPDDIQSAIREHCGDRPTSDGPSFELPPDCTIELPNREAAATAAALRATPRFQAELRWHMAAVANQLQNVGTLKHLLRDLMAELGS